MVSSVFLLEGITTLVKNGTCLCWWNIQAFCFVHPEKDAHFQWAQVSTWCCYSEKPEQHYIVDGLVQANQINFQQVQCKWPQVVLLNVGNYVSMCTLFQLFSKVFLLCTTITMCSATMGHSSLAPRNNWPCFTSQNNTITTDLVKGSGNFNHLGVL